MLQGARWAGFHSHPKGKCFLPHCLSQYAFGRVIFLIIIVVIALRVRSGCAVAAPTGKPDPKDAWQASSFLWYSLRRVGSNCKAVRVDRHLSTPHPPPFSTFHTPSSSSPSSYSSLPLSSLLFLCLLLLLRLLLSCPFTSEDLI